MARRGLAVAAALAAALALPGSAGCAALRGCGAQGGEGVGEWRPDVESDEVTERDLEAARHLSAPDWVVEGLERALADGTDWIGLGYDFDSAYRTIRHAEFAEDYLAARYGESFACTYAAVPSGVLKGETVATLTVTTGPEAGSEVRASFYGEGRAPLQWEDDYQIVLVRDEWDAEVTASFDEAFGDLPEGERVLRETITDSYYYGDHPGASFDVVRSEVGGAIGAYVSAESGITEAELRDRFELLCSSLAAKGLDVHVYVARIGVPTEGAAFTFDFIRDHEDDEGLVTWEFRLDSTLGYEGASGDV